MERKETNKFTKKQFSFDVSPTGFQITNTNNSKIEKFQYAMDFLKEKGFEITDLSAKLMYSKSERECELEEPVLSINSCKLLQRRTGNR